MVPGGARPCMGVDRRDHGVADLDLAGLDLAVMAEDVGLDLLRVVHREKRQARAGARKFAAIADLAAGLRVERRAVENDDALLARSESESTALPSR